jgi:hypothetical protein
VKYCDLLLKKYKQIVAFLIKEKTMANHFESMHVKDTKEGKKEGTQQRADITKQKSQETAKQQEVLTKIQEPLKKFFEEHLDHKDKEVLEKGKISSFSRDNNKLKLEVDGLDGKEKREFSIELDKLSTEERDKLKYEVERHLVASYFDTDPQDVNKLERSDDQRYTYENRDGASRGGKLYDDQKVDRDDILSSLGLGDRGGPEASELPSRKTDGIRPKENTIRETPKKGEDTSGEKSLEDLYKEGDRIKKQGDRISNFMGFMNIANTVSMQATGNLEVLVDRMLQTEGNPNSMQGMYNPSQFIHDAYNRNIDQKLHANRSEINIRKQELRRTNDGKEGKEKIQKQIEELGKKAGQKDGVNNEEKDKKAVNNEEKAENEEKE